MYASSHGGITWQRHGKGVEADICQSMTEPGIGEGLAPTPAGVLHRRLSGRPAEKASKAGPPPFLTIYKEQTWLS
jgi:hypothetical protein